MRVYNDAWVGAFSKVVILRGGYYSFFSQNSESRATKKNEQFPLFSPQAAEAVPSDLVMLMATLEREEALSY